jgi:hypothetical protein
VYSRARSKGWSAGSRLRVWRWTDVPGVCCCDAVRVSALIFYVESHVSLQSSLVTCKVGNKTYHDGRLHFQVPLKHRIFKRVQKTYRPAAAGRFTPHSWPNVFHMSKIRVTLPSFLFKLHELAYPSLFAPTTAMSSVRPMTPADLLKFNPCNLDHLTETYNIGFYLDYFSKWPELCMVIEAPHGEIEGYSQYHLPLTPLYYPQLTHPSPRQTRILPLRRTLYTLRPHLPSLHETIPKLPPLARPHNLPNNLPFLTPPGPRNRPLLLPRNNRKPRKRLVRRPLRASRKYSCDRTVQENGLFRV